MTEKGLISRTQNRQEEQELTNKMMTGLQSTVFFQEYINMHTMVEVIKEGQH
jgi:hypothetical protein